MERRARGGRVLRSPRSRCEAGARARLLRRSVIDRVLDLDGHKAVIDLRAATLDDGVGGGGYLSYVYDDTGRIGSGFTIAGNMLAGADVLDPPDDQPWGERQSVLTDPDGHVVCLVKPLA